MEFRHDLGNALTIPSDKLRARNLRALHFAVRVEQREYLSSQAVASMRVFIDPQQRFALPGVQERALLPGYFTTFNLRLKVFINRKQCQNSAKTESEFHLPGTYTAEICRKEVELQDVFTRCGCILNIRANGSHFDGRYCSEADKQCIDASHTNVSEVTRTHCLPACKIEEWDAITTQSRARNKSSDLVYGSFIFPSSRTCYYERKNLNAFFEIGKLLGMQSGSSLISVIELFLLGVITFANYVFFSRFV